MNIVRLTVLAADDDGSFTVMIGFRDPSGREKVVRAKTKVTLSDQDRSDLHWYLEKYLEQTFPPHEKRAARIEERMEELGEALFRDLFQANEDARDAWAKRRETLPDTRVEIDADVAAGTAIPWELIRDPRLNQWLALEAASFVRVQSQNGAEIIPPTLSEGDKLRVLLVICRPDKADDVPFRSVASRLLKSITADDRQRVALTLLRPPGFDGLAKELERAMAASAPYHILHFDGHGMYADLAAQKAGGGGVGFSNRWLGQFAKPGKHGYLCFESDDATDNHRPVSGEELGNLMRRTGVPVLLLNACRSAHAEAAVTDGQDGPQNEQVKAFGSLAQEVVNAGVAGVLAMRYNVWVVTAAQYVETLYAGLVAGKSLSAAANDARRDLFAKPHRGIAGDGTDLRDWMVPVVFEATPVKLLPPVTGATPLGFGGTAAAGWSGSDGALPPPPDIGFVGRDETVLAIDRGFDKHRVVLLHAYAGAGKTSTAAEFARWYRDTGGLGQGGLVLFDSFERHDFTTTLPGLLAKLGGLFEPALAAQGINWGALNDTARRDLALNILAQVPVLWIWDNVEPVAGFPGTGRPKRRVTDTPDPRPSGERVEPQVPGEGALRPDGRTPEIAGVSPSPHPLPPASPVLNDGPRSGPGARDLDEESMWSPEQQRELRDFLAHVNAAPGRGRILLTSRRDEAEWLGNVPARVKAPPLRWPDRLRMAELLATRHGHGNGFHWALTPLLDYSQGNPMALTVLVGQALRDGLTTREQVEAHVAKLRAGEAGFDDDESQGRSRSLGASLAYGFDAAFSGLERQRLSLLHLFQGVVNAGVLTIMGLPENPGVADAYREVTREDWTRLLDRAAEIGLLSKNDPWYTIHPALPWFLKSLFDAAWPDGTVPRRAYAWAVAQVGTTLATTIIEGNHDALTPLRMEEANLRHAHSLAHAGGWVDDVFSAMQGLREIYQAAGRWEVWRRDVEAAEPLVRAPDGSPLPGQENNWSLWMDYAIRLAGEDHHADRQETLLRDQVKWEREWAGSTTDEGTPLDAAQRHRLQIMGNGQVRLGSFLRTRNAPEAVTWLEESRRVNQRLGDTRGESITRFNLGHAYIQITAIRDLGRAEEHYRASLDLCDEADHTLRSNCHGQLGFVALERFEEARRNGGTDKAELIGFLQTAEAEYQRSLELTPEDDLSGRAVSHAMLGNLYDAAGMVDSATEQWGMAVKLHLAAGNRFEAGKSRFNIASLYARSGRFTDARDYAEAALEDFRSYGANAAEMIARTEQLLALIAELEAEAAEGGGTV